METLRIALEPTPREIVVLVVEHSDEIRSAVAAILEENGYVVIEAEDLAEACDFIDTVATPVVALVGDVGVGDQDGVACFTAVTASSGTRRAYIYLTNTPECRQIPTLVYGLPQVGTTTPRQSFELVSLLAVVADAASRARVM